MTATPAAVPQPRWVRSERAERRRVPDAKLLISKKAVRGERQAGRQVSVCSENDSPAERRWRGGGGEKRHVR